MVKHAIITLIAIKLLFYISVKKAYYKLSLQCHPDRVPEQQKAESTEKFKLLTKLYNVLIDDGKRNLYNEKGIIDDDDECSSLGDWIKLWNSIFKPITEEDIEKYERNYRYSEQEKSDIKRSYVQGKGCINHLMNSVPFLRVEDEDRLKIIVTEMIDSGDVESFPIFTNEPAAKRNRRHKKYAMEAKLAEKEIAKRESLAAQMNKNQLERANNAKSFFDNLIAKYGNDNDDSDVIDFKKLKSKKSKRSKESKDALHSTKKGRITRNK